jgi:hypothetical protein
VATQTLDPNQVILTGENPFIRLSGSDEGQATTDASLWRILLSPAGPGHVLYFKSELTDGRWRIYSDNIALARWLQTTVQGMLNADTADPAIAVIEARFDKTGDLRSFWTETVRTSSEEVQLSWHDLGEPLLLHMAPGERPYGVSSILIPAAEARLTLNGIQAQGTAWPRDRDGRPFSTCALAFSESWTAPPA